MDLGLKDAAVCVSGGSKGIGRATALAFAGEGARVVITSRNGKDLTRVVDELLTAGAPDAFGLQADVGNAPDIASLFTQIENRWGELNTLVNMASSTDPARLGAFLDLDDEDWDYHYTIGLLSVVRCSRAAIPLMRRAGWGRIINVSSISSRLGMPFDMPYTATKAGLNALTKSLGRTFATENILINTITPGAFYTASLRHQLIETGGVKAGLNPDSLLDAAQWVADRFDGRPVGAIGRVAMPEEIGPQILLLGSRANSYMAGANVVIDGGTDFSTG
ncbi:SDR family NAD(P)-dependent oxidoreductase [Parasphingorhabdus sp.]|uniref:SDR family NAD(P)-dependent oxidoreductase n=1 Tax=Parasphingorhabdus sp. TaxID=2709688 RepID=UPI003A8FA6C6